MGRQRLILLLVTTAVLLAGSGCWDRNEPENRAFIVGVGFDYDQESKLYEIVVQIADPSAAEAGASAEGGGQGKPSVAVTSAKGITPFDAARNLGVYLSRAPFFAHNRIFVLTEKLAREKLGPVLDFFERERENRLIANPLVLQGASLQELFRTEMPLEQLSAEGISRQVGVLPVERAAFPRVTMIDYFITKSTPGVEPLMGRLTLGRQTEEDQIAGEKPVIRNTIEADGAAIFQGERMVGWVDQRTIRGWHWVTGRVLRAVETIMCPAHDIHPISIEIYEATANPSPRLDPDGQPRVEVVINADARIQNQACPTGYVLSSEYTQSLDRRLATAIRNDIAHGLETAKQLESDIFGFGTLFYRSMPKLWEQWSRQWNSRYFPQLPVDIQVHANIRRDGMTTAPVFSED